MRNVCFLAGSLATPLLLLLSWLGIVSAAKDAPCYDSAGKPLGGYYPCDPSGYVTNCCQQGYTCFSNSLCVVTTRSNSFPNLTIGDVQRGACTNPLWNNNVCGDYCLDDANAKGAIAACGGDRFCCGNEFNVGSCNCSSNGGAFTLRPGRPQTIIDVFDTSFTGSPTYVSPVRVTSTSSSVPKTTSGSQPASLTAFGATAGRNSTANPNQNPSATTAGASASGATSSGNGTSPDDGSGSGTGNSSNSLRIGLAVGITAAAVVAIGALLFCLRRRRQKTEPIPSNPFPPGDPAENGDNDSVGYGPPKR